MAIRDDIDVMLNSLKNGGTSANKPKSSAAGNKVPHKAPAARKTVYDNMSVDDLLNELIKEKKPTAAAPAPEKKTETVSTNAAEKKAPVQTSVAKTPAQPQKKKKIVISGELPDYEAIRKDELAKAEAKRLAEEAERKAAEEAEAKRLAEEAERKAAEEAEAKRLAEEAERKAAEEAEAKRLAEEAERKAAEEAEAKRLAEEAERKAAEEAEAKRLAEEAERKAAEEAEAKRLDEESSEDEATEASDNDYSEEEFADIDKEECSNEPKGGLFSKIKGLFSKNNTEDNDAADDFEADEETLEELSPAEETEAELIISEELIESDSEETAVITETGDIKEDMQSAADLVDAALAAIEEVQLEIAEENNADALAEETPEDDPVEEMLEDIRDEAASTIADIEAEKSEISDNTDEETADVSEADAETKPETNIDISVGEPEKKGRITAALERILDENPDEISNERSEKTEPDEIDVSLEKKGSGNFKKHLYAVLGIVFTILAVVGLVTVVKNGILYIRSFTAGESQMDSFTEVVYPAVIMDIDSFESPSELSSEQIISAALWSLVMSDEEMAKYEETFDVISVPSIDVEAYAAKLFGSGIPELAHGTVGSGELKFYYNEETKAYNVPVKPITFTYEPSIKSVAKNGSNYTVKVDYINELPSWMEEVENTEDLIAKTVEFRLTETNGQYAIVGMKVLSINSEM